MSCRYIAMQSLTVELGLVVGLEIQGAAEECLEKPHKQ